MTRFSVIPEENLAKELSGQYEDSTETTGTRASQLVK